jgi:hypothetical protein
MYELAANLYGDVQDALNMDDPTDTCTVALYTDKTVIGADLHTHPECVTIDFIIADNLFVDVANAYQEIVRRRNAYRKAAAK